MSYSKLQYSFYRRFPVLLQNWFVTNTGNKRWRHERSSTFQRKVDWLTDNQFSDSTCIREYQGTKLIDVLMAARSTEYYRMQGCLNGAVFSDPFSVLAAVPTLRKGDVCSDFRRFINPGYSGRLHQHGTSGTTGTPLQTVWTMECMDAERALIWRQRRVTGFEYGKEWRGMLGGHQIVPLEQKKPPFWRVNRIAKQLYFSTYHLSPETASSYLEALKKYNVKVLEGYPSVLYAMAYGLWQCGLVFPLQSIYYGAEPLQDFQRALIEQVFCCYVWDYYGLTERVASASEFECRNGLHENWENCILEIVDPDGKPVPDGEYGELVGTSLSNLGFPLLRYRTGDMTRFLPGKCSCGRHSRRIARIDTKREDLLLMPDGALLSASNLTFPFKTVKNIAESQIHQTAINRLQICIVPDKSYTDEDGVELLCGLRAYIPDSVALSLKLVEEIPRTKTGKFRFCISDLKVQNE